jgi:hypothetical protein
MDAVVRSTDRPMRRWYYFRQFHAGRKHDNCAGRPPRSPPPRWQCLNSGGRNQWVLPTCERRTLRSIDPELQPHLQHDGSTEFARGRLAGQRQSLNSGRLTHGNFATRWDCFDRSWIYNLADSDLVRLDLQAQRPMKGPGENPKSAYGEGLINWKANSSCRSYFPGFDTWLFRS